MTLRPYGATPLQGLWVSPVPLMPYRAAWNSDGVADAGPDGVADAGPDGVADAWGMVEGPLKCKLTKKTL